MKKGFSNVRCPKCNGNVFFEGSNRNIVELQDELTGWCLQCGYTVYPKRDRILAEELMSVSSDVNNA